MAKENNKTKNNKAKQKEEEAKKTSAKSDDLRFPNADEIYE